MTCLKEKNKKSLNQGAVPAEQHQNEGNCPITYYKLPIVTESFP